jgi:hypothetical protein
MSRNSAVVLALFLVGCSGAPFTLAENDAGESPPDVDASPPDGAQSSDADGGVDVSPDAAMGDAGVDALEPIDASLDAAAADTSTASDSAPPALCCFITPTYGVACDTPASWSCVGASACTSSACAVGVACVTSNHATGSISPCP